MFYQIFSNYLLDNHQQILIRLLLDYIIKNCLPNSYLTSIKIINIMKTINRPADSDSFSTQQRDRKFHRKSQGRRSLSNSSRSESKSLSKFFIRNLQTTQKPEGIERMINKNINPKLSWSPPRRKPTPSKTQKQKKITYTQEQLLESQRKQIENLNHQISKYKAYIQNQSDKIHEANKENTKLKDQIKALKKMLEQQKNCQMALQKQMSEINANLAHKQVMLQYWQKEQPALKKVKTSIFQARMIQFDKQKQELNRKIRDLEAIIQDCKASSISHSTDSYREFGLGAGRLSLPVDKSAFYEEQHIQVVEYQLYQAREEIKRLQITQRCNKRKFYKQLEVYKQKKEKQYEQLKKKFYDFLAKYKQTMKKVASFQAKHAAQKRNKQRSNSFESLASLTLSQENQ